ncbi:MAG: DUF2125 domain-containing protein [Pseudomonadota bacterium]
MRRLRFLIGVILVGSLAWTGWWFLAAAAKETALSRWFENRRDAGWTAQTAALQVTGFPARLDTILSDLRLADPGRGWAWEAEAFQILALAYQPNHIIVAWPGVQRIAWRDLALTLQAEQWRGSVVFVPDLALPLDELRMEVAGLQASVENGWNAAVTAGQIAVRRSPGQEAPSLSYDLFATLEAVALPPEWAARYDRDEVLGASLDVLRVSAQVALDAPLDRFALEGRQPAIRTADLQDAQLVWGGVAVKGTGRLAVSAEGIPEGRIDLEIRNWQDLLARLREAGAIDPALARTLVSGLAVLATLSGDADALRAPLVFSGGQMALGPVPLGPAPRLPAPRLLAPRLPAPGLLQRPNLATPPAQDG